MKHSTYLSLGSAPCDEDCAQLGYDDNYAVRARRECHAYVHQLRRMFGEPPAGAHFSVTGSEHDFGRYYEVVIMFDPDNPAAVAYACRCEDEAPAEWDLAARLELDRERKRERDSENEVAQ